MKHLLQRVICMSLCAALGMCVPFPAAASDIGDDYERYPAERRQEKKYQGKRQKKDRKNSRRKKIRNSRRRKRLAEKIRCQPLLLF